MARRTTAARRYAEAVFELAQRDDALDRWQADLDTLAAFTVRDEVIRVVGNPAMPMAERRKVMEQLAGDRVDRQALNLALVLMERRRIEHLPAVAREYRRLLNRERGVVEATVTSAAELTTDETAAIRERIERMTGATVDLDVVVDPDLIGGVAVRVGDQLIDASVRGRLERLRERLVAGAR